MNSKSCFLRAGALGLLVSSPWLHAALIFDNLNTADTPVQTYSSQWWGQSFIVPDDGENPSYALISVVLSMGAAQNTSGNFFVGIYNATGPGVTPGSGPLATLIGSPNPATAGNYAYFPGGTVSLDASTTYYVVAGVSSGSGNYNWNIEFDPPGSVETGSTVGHSSGIVNSGTSTNWSTPNDGIGFNMQVNVVPEPLNVALGVFGVAFVLLQLGRSSRVRKLIFKVVRG